MFPVPLGRSLGEGGFGATLFGSDPVDSKTLMIAEPRINASVLKRRKWIVAAKVRISFHPFRVGCPLTAWSDSSFERRLHMFAGDSKMETHFSGNLPDWSAR